MIIFFLFICIFSYESRKVIFIFKSTIEDGTDLIDENKYSPKVQVIAASGDNIIAVANPALAMSPAILPLSIDSRDLKIADQWLITIIYTYYFKRYFIKREFNERIINNVRYEIENIVINYVIDILQLINIL